jgi:hypothetical protein
MSTLFMILQINIQFRWFGKKELVS